MTVVTTIDVYGMHPSEYRAILDYMGVETRPASGIYLHLTATMDFGYRVIEIWDRKEGFDEFLEKRLAPAAQALGINREMKISVTPLHNFFAPRLEEMPGLIASLPGAHVRVPTYEGTDAGRHGDPSAIPSKNDQN